jgi:hypothetical protein
MSLPVSLLGSVALLGVAGETINLISLAAMILVLGIVVVLAKQSFSSMFLMEGTMGKFIELVINSKRSPHGPCLSDKDEMFDLAFCFHLHTWPRQAEQWIYRHRV